MKSFSAERYYWSAITWFPAQKRYTLTAYNKVGNDTPGEATTDKLKLLGGKEPVFLFDEISHLEPTNALACLMESER